ncbi:MULTISPECIES: phasin family protein [Niveibacterium]|uniref:Phasin family protein n=1 Tax=Niveibacterium microcysteis TaxID=2811415 RepID=A0ABX7M1C5_9RHOO|nr:MULTISPECIES: phasin family protein [Niveibacterium]QSI75564.1 phasin family protein [Niveibacterium microcysteis]
MVKKLKSLSGADSQLAQTIKDSASQIWLAGLGAFAKAQEEGNKVFEALVKEGEVIQARTKKEADAKIADAAGKMAGAWDKLENVFEERVSRALSSLGVPTKKDIDKLTKRVAELTALVQKLTEEAEAVEVAGEEKPARRRAAAKAAE